MRYPLVLAAMLMGIVQLTAAPVATAQTSSDMAIVAEKLRADKKLLVSTNMQLSEAEAKGFWPVYEAYQGDLRKINAKMTDIISSFAKDYGAMTDDKAKALM